MRTFSSRKRQIVVAAIVLILVGGGWFFWFRKSNPPLPADLERILVQLEQMETEYFNESRTHALSRIKQLSPPKTANQHIFIGIMHASHQDYRSAWLSYQAAADIDKDIADPHWGKAAALYALAVLDMKARGLCNVTKVDWPSIAARVSKNTYLRRDGDILCKGFFNFRAVATAMKTEGWNEKEAMGVQMLVQSVTPTDLPPDLNFIEMARRQFPSDLYPLAEFTPDEQTRSLLKLAEAEFREADSKTRRLGSFVPVEMQSIEKRVQALLRKQLPLPSEDDLRYLAQVQQRYAHWRNPGYLLHPLYKELTKLHDQAEREKEPGLYAEAGILILTMGNNYTLSEDLLHKSLKALPGTDGPSWGLAVAYHSLAVFDLVDRGLYEVKREELTNALRADLARLPERQTTLVGLQMAAEAPYQTTLVEKGFDELTRAALLQLINGLRTEGRLEKVSVLTLKPDDKARALFRIALYHAETARRGTPLPLPDQRRLFRPQDVEALYPYLVAQAGLK